MPLEATATAPAEEVKPAAPAPTTTAAATAPAETKPATAAVWTKPPATAEAKPETKGEAAAPPAEAKPEAAKTPEKLALKAPEGSSLDAAYLERFGADASALGLTEKQANAILERNWKEKQLAAAADSEAMKAQERTWLETLQTDKDFGGAKFAENAEHAKRFFDWFDADGSLRKSLDAAGLSHWPELVKKAAEKGRTFAEDKLHVNAPGVPKRPADPFERLKASYAKSSQQGSGE